MGVEAVRLIEWPGHDGDTRVARFLVPYPEAHTNQEAFFFFLSLTCLERELTSVSRRAHCEQPQLVVATKSIHERSKQMDTHEQHNQISNDHLEKSGWLVALICAMALPAGGTLVSEVLQGGGELNEAALTAMSQVFLLSAPLVLAVGLSSIVVMREWTDRDSGKVMGLLLAIWGSAFFLSVIGVGVEIVWSFDKVTHGPAIARFIGNFLVHYYLALGPALFVASILLGIWLGVVTNQSLDQSLSEIEEDLF